ncbi:MAG: hypothetical protein OER90_19100 [Gemmatimonadota bacterium]|nr:hypothetical protein [Gemmatimonadota bacterium]
MRHLIPPLTVFTVACSLGPQQVTPNERIFNETVDCVVRVAAAAGYALESGHNTNRGDGRLLVFAAHTPRIEVLVAGRRPSRQIHLWVSYRYHWEPPVTAGQRWAAETLRQVREQCTPEGMATVADIYESIEQYLADGRIDDVRIAEDLRGHLDRVIVLMDLDGSTRASTRAADELGAFIDYLNAPAGTHIDSGAARTLADAAGQIIDVKLNPGLRAVESLMDAVSNFASEGIINEKQARALLVNLEAANRQLGQVQPAVRRLEAFTNQVQAYLDAGILLPEQRQLLIGMAAMALDQLAH